MDHPPLRKCHSTTAISDVQKEHHESEMGHVLREIKIKRKADDRERVYKNKMVLLLNGIRVWGRQRCLWLWLQGLSSKFLAFWLSISDTSIIIYQKNKLQIPCYPWQLGLYPCCLNWEWEEMKDNSRVSHRDEGVWQGEYCVSRTFSALAGSLFLSSFAMVCLVWVIAVALSWASSLSSWMNFIAWNYSNHMDSRRRKFCTFLENVRLQICFTNSVFHAVCRNFLFL